MVGVNRGLVALCRNDETFPRFFTHHCIIHQQALCGKFLKMIEVMTLVIKIVNNVRAHSLKRRQFKQLAEEMDCQYGDLLLHNEVKWLSVKFCILDYRAPAKDLQIIGVARGPKRLATPGING
uniref:General transcription factor II-I repeat domain-containing protein 2 n=1 Tax=Cacopsylla melanoneura TaxID=428564 RepID=A0A8D8TXF0_9HEMI